MKAILLIYFVLIASFVMQSANSPPADNPAMTTSVTAMNQFDENFATADLLAVLGPGSGLQVQLSVLSLAQKNMPCFINGSKESAEENEVKAVARNGGVVDLLINTSNNLLIVKNADVLNQQVAVKEVGNNSREIVCIQQIEDSNSEFS